MLTQNPDIPLNPLMTSKLISLLFFSPRDIYTQQKNSLDTPSGFRREKLTCNIRLLCHHLKKKMQFDYCRRKRQTNVSEIVDTSIFMFVPLCLHGCNNKTPRSPKSSHTPSRCRKCEVRLASPALHLY